MATQGETGSDPPGFLAPGFRCAVEMLAVAGIMLLVGLPASNTVYLGLVVALTVLSVTVVLFWCLNRQMEAWIAHARRQGHRSTNRTE
jgi:hypothetical protein